MDSLNDAIIKLMKDNGADLVGFGDLSSALDDDLNKGVCIAIKVDKDIIRGIHNGPNLEYYKEYTRINNLLDKLVTMGAEYLKSNGYKAYAQTRDVTLYGPDLLTKLPHKTVATRSGLGWIGKCAVLVTKEYGSAVRLSSFLTNAPLICAKPVDQSSCGNCTNCRDNCPAKAIYGVNWSVSSNREELIDPFACEKKADELCLKNFGIKVTICGKCIEVCPFTQKYLNKER
ncbi:MAG: 4Fe-4S dicluster domain-containing protein [Oscillospiraceae bacterium]|nr:4Fe-4S dicluster domain-containing protein [Oscillospiraceae bacterium]